MRSQANLWSTLQKPQRHKETASPYPDAAWFIQINFKWWSFNRTSKFQKMTEAFTTKRTWLFTYQLSFPPHLGKVHGFIIFRILWGGWNSWSRNQGKPHGESEGVWCVPVYSDQRSLFGHIYFPWDWGTSYIFLFCFMVAFWGAYTKKIGLRHAARKLQ